MDAGSETAGVWARDKKCGAAQAHGKAWEGLGSTGVLPVVIGVSPGTSDAEQRLGNRGTRCRPTRGGFGGTSALPELVVPGHFSIPAAALPRIPNCTKALSLTVAGSGLPPGFGGGSSFP